MELKRVKRTKVGDQAFEQLRSMIENGNWAVGEKIPSERELCLSMGVSHATVRQVLQKLNALGLIETRAGYGSCVKALAPQNCLDMLPVAKPIGAKAWQDVIEFREMLEIYAVQMAAKRATAEDIAMLRENHLHMIEKTTADDYAALDVEFHTMIGQITRNDMIVRSYEILNGILKQSIVDEIDRVGIIRQEDHRKIIDAIEQHDVRLAGALMSAHILDVGKDKHAPDGALMFDF
ncbi:FadR/GntR family transcriptional regulator [Pseudoflavonifractor sp. MSJ-37]|uniref:FadR/GntR family transcriptional regulator n=1 Tax=Pseudoflavonifractor sp. MSJ-37 TaxID=2841531 RepID=UPI001C10430D|nr:FadR/GntR family transcriptional regulator [Pseudoflavonifractor sp. MSJ-37]MBU5435136.1 FadR family transcriptional regulator [Pseudoflavonifractor sp. MSJ-37]